MWFSSGNIAPTADAAGPGPFYADAAPSPNTPPDAPPAPPALGAGRDATAARRLPDAWARRSRAHRPSGYIPSSVGPLAGSMGPVPSPLAYSLTMRTASSMSSVT